MLHQLNTPEDFILDHRFINYCFKNDEADELYWEQWITNHPEKKDLVEKARHLVLTISVSVPSEEKQKEWEKMPLKKGGRKATSTFSSKKGTSGAIFKGSRVAAVLLVLIALWWFVDQNKKEENHPAKKEQVTEVSPSYSTRYGEQQKIILTDGTEVWLNADSKLAYSSDFSEDDKREVTLSGEAYFDVAQKADQPFIVHTGGMNIIVLGTSFNVKAYPKDRSFETTLIEGAVDVRLKEDPSKTIRLKPKEKITVFKKSAAHPIHRLSDSLLSMESVPKFSVSQVYKDPHLDDKVLETVWRQGKLAFKDESFDVLALQFNHRYGVKLHFKNSALKSYRYTGVFTKESLEQALKALQLTSPSHPFTYRIKNKDVFIALPENQQE